MNNVPIDMNQLVYSFEDESQDNKYYLDRETGEIRLVHEGLHELRDLTDEIETDRERFLYIPKQDPKKIKGDLRDFIDTIDDAKTKMLLDVAMDSPHILSGFKKILESTGVSDDELKAFLERRTRLRVKQWLSANSIDVENELQSSP
ncbi:MAG: UPF0158 family protein [Candidatus Melainabacteria bacterium]|nr:UPF0158 family protein [Candidatus Melainabacteria bacterium]